MATVDGMPKKTSKLTVFIALIVAIFTGIVGAIFGYSADKTLNEEGEIDIMPAFTMMSEVANTPQIAIEFAVKNKESYARKFAMYGFVGVAIFSAYKLTSGKRFHRKGEEHGSAKWGNDTKKRSLSDKKDLFNNIIYADDIYLVLDRKQRDINRGVKKKKSNSPVGNKKKQLDLTKKIEIKADNSKVQKVQAMLNLNAVVIGGTGTGKSRFFVKPNLLQCNTSFVVTDPSGELLQSCGKMLERNGYEIKVFNLMNMEHSSNYNPFHYLVDYNGEYNANNVIKMINTFMMNTKSDGASGGDQFWDDATKLLLSAVCFFLVETGNEEDKNFTMVLDLIRKAKADEGSEIESELDLIFEEHRKDSPRSLSVQYYDEFKQAAGKTIQSILISTTTKLQTFKLPDVANLTHTDTIHLETLGDKKTALFIIIPSTDTTYNFLAAMMYTQLFDTLFDRAIQKYGGRLPIHVRFILDEFANVGKLPNFETVLATMRKFEISATVILQNLAQLKRLYEKSWEEIPGNADTMLYLGGKDQSTNEYISKELGKETIDTLAINKTKSRQGSTSYNDGIMGRELLTIDELAKMDNSNCICLVRGFPPFKTLKYRLEKHPRYSELEECDKENNTFEISSVKTLRQAEILDITNLDDNIFSDEIINTQGITIKVISNNEVTTNIDTLDNFSDFSDETNSIFENITGALFREMGVT